MAARQIIEERSPLWHAMPLSEVFRTLDSDEAGLSSARAAQRLAEVGPNRLPEARPRSGWKRFLAQFHNVLIYVLLAAALVTTLLHHWVDTSVIVSVVVVNALIGFVQEGKAEDALAAIRQMLSPHALTTWCRATCCPCKPATRSPPTCA
jgi:magnesium-transporting ATPase (P-type)